MLFGSGQVAQLNGVVAICGLGFDLGHGARPRLHDSDRNGQPFWREDLGHADFSSEDAKCHKNLQSSLHDSFSSTESQLTPTIG
jgi:hypothetical protein